jgi:hypothetical protein
MALGSFAISSGNSPFRILSISCSMVIELSFATPLLGEEEEPELPEVPELPELTYPPELPEPLPPPDPSTEPFEAGIVDFPPGAWPSSFPSMASSRNRA